MTEPTNKELDAVIKHHRTRIYPQDMQPHFERAIMRAVLAKWGQPAQARADSVQEDADRYRWLREGNDVQHGAAWHVAVNLYGFEWDAAIDAARAAQKEKP